MHDGPRAVRWVREKAAGFNIDLNKIGIIGFSAVCHLASTVDTHFDAGDPGVADPIDHVSCRPDFAILVYAVISMKDGVTNAVCNKNLLCQLIPPSLSACSTKHRSRRRPTDDSLRLRGRSAGAHR